MTSQLRGSISVIRDYIQGAKRVKKYTERMQLHSLELTEKHLAYLVQNENLIEGGDEKAKADEIFHQKIQAAFKYHGQGIHENQVCMWAHFSNTTKFKDWSFLLENKELTKNEFSIEELKELSELLLAEALDSITDAVSWLRSDNNSSTDRHRHSHDMLIAHRKVVLSDFFRTLAEEKMRATKSSL